MNRNEKFAVMNALHLTAEEVKVYFDNHVAKTVPLPLLLRNSDDQLWESSELVKDNTLVGIIVGDEIWSAKVFPNDNKISWYEFVEWAKTQDLGGLPANLPTLPNISTLASKYSQVKETVRLLKIYGVDVDDFEEGRYLTSTSSGDQEKVYPRCFIDSTGVFKSKGFSSKSAPNHDIVRLVAKLKK